MGTARRALFASFLAGGAVAASGSRADAATTGTCVVPVSALRNGDLVVGPGGLAVRISSVVRSGTRYTVKAIDPYDGRAVVLKPRIGTTYAGTQRFVLLLRGVPASAVPLAPRPTAPVPAVIDGGRP
ncbi:MAG TPA: hypothetical protein VM575_13900 [Nocardioides sp.]|nr:hypothetical protein [Nocardioides sp.]